MLVDMLNSRSIHGARLRLPRRPIAAQRQTTVLRAPPVRGKPSLATRIIRPRLVRRLVTHLALRHEARPLRIACAEGGDNVCLGAGSAVGHGLVSAKSSRRTQIVARRRVGRHDHWLSFNNQEREAPIICADLSSSTVDAREPTISNSPADVPQSKSSQNNIIITCSWHRMLSKC